MDTPTIYLYRDPVDFRKQALGPASLVEQDLGHDPFSGEFGVPDASKMDFVITVCDNAAGEVCPIWPGHPISAHWGIPDPAEVKGDDEAAKKAFADAIMVLSSRIALMVNLPFEKLDRLALQKELAGIGIQKA